MTVNIQLGPEEEQALIERARGSGHDLTDYIHQVLREHIGIPATSAGGHEAASGPTITLEDLIDDEAIASCEAEADDGISLEDVRAATSRIKDSMASVVIEDERAERF